VAAIIRSVEGINGIVISAPVRQEIQPEFQLAGVSDDYVYTARHGAYKAALEGHQHAHSCKSRLTPLDQLAINTVRFLSVDAIQKANSGHPGLPLGAAPMAYVLWTRFLRHNPTNPHWCNRDRFVLSAGHGPMLLYSLLHLTGYDVPLEQIKQFRQAPVM
jgi:hypothetical protein